MSRAVSTSADVCMPKEQSKLQRHRAEKATVGDFYAADVSCSLLSHLQLSQIYITAD